MSVETNAPWRELGIELARHGRGLHLIKSELVARLPGGLDLAAIGVLHHLAAGEGCRQGELADSTQLDPSTVSRHVAQLVRSGYVARTSHPGDARAVVLSPTPEGRRLYEIFSEHRHALIQSIMADWDVADVATLTDLLTRLNDDIEARRTRQASPARSAHPIATQEP